PTTARPAPRRTPTPRTPAPGTLPSRSAPPRTWAPRGAARPGPHGAPRQARRTPGPGGRSGRGEPKRPTAPGVDFTPASAVVGIALLAVVIAETYVGVAQLGLGNGQVLLAFALALDACARALGTVAARRAEEVQWGWWCALGGSPLVAAFALF